MDELSRSNSTRKARFAESDGSETGPVGRERAMSQFTRPRRATIRRPPGISVFDEQEEHNNLCEQDLTEFTRKRLVSNQIRDKEFATVDCKSAIHQFMKTSAFGIVWEFIQVGLSIIGIVVYIGETYTQDQWFLFETTRKSAQWTFLEKIEVAISLLFFVDIVLSYITSPSALDFFKRWYTWLDILSLIPLLDLLLVGVEGLGVLRMLRMFRVLRILRAYRLIYISRSNAFVKETSVLIYVILVIVIVAAAVMQILEPELLPTFHDSIYFTIVTMTTVGYGDIAPQKSYSRMALCIFIFVTIIIIPVRLRRILQLLTLASPYAGSFSGSGARDHVLITGRFDGQSLDTFLSEFFHSNHGFTDTDVAILGHYFPDRDMRLVLEGQIGVVRCQYLQGSPMDIEDLERSKCSKATAVFILADKILTDTVQKQEADAEAILTTLSVRQVLPQEVPVFVQVLLPRNRPVVYDVGATHVLCVEEFRMQMLAGSIYCKALHVVIGNLVQSVEKFNGLQWLEEYSNGASHQLYEIRVRQEFTGQAFSSCVDMMYRATHTIVVGVRSQYCSGSVLLNPGEDYVITESDSLFVIAANARAAHVLLQAPLSRSEEKIGGAALRLGTTIFEKLHTNPYSRAKAEGTRTEETDLIDVITEATRGHTAQEREKRKSIRFKTPSSDIDITDPVVVAPGTPTATSTLTRRMSDIFGVNRTSHNVLNGATTTSSAAAEPTSANSNVSTSRDVDTTPTSATATRHNAVSFGGASLTPSGRMQSFRKGGGIVMNQFSKLKHRSSMMAASISSGDINGTSADLDRTASHISSPHSEYATDWDGYELDDSSEDQTITSEVGLDDCDIEIDAEMNKHMLDDYEFDYRAIASLTDLPPTVYNFHVLRRERPSVLVTHIPHDIGNHVLVVGAVNDCLSFVLPLRSRDLAQRPPIVFLCPELPDDDQMHMLKWFEYVYVIKGDVDKSKVAGLDRTAAVVVLGTNIVTNRVTSMEEGGQRNQPVDASDKHDQRVILRSLTLHSNTHKHFISVLSNLTNARFLTPMLRDKKGRRIVDMGRGVQPGEIISAIAQPAYISGQVFADTLVDKLLCMLHYNVALGDIVPLLLCSPAFNSPLTRMSSHLFLLNIPKRFFAEHSQPIFKDLFLWLVRRKENKYVAIGLYRTGLGAHTPATKRKSQVFWNASGPLREPFLGTSAAAVSTTSKHGDTTLAEEEGQKPPPYVATVPPYDTKVFTSDSVYVLGFREANEVDDQYESDDETNTMDD